MRRWRFIKALCLAVVLASGAGCSHGALDRYPTLAPAASPTSPPLRAQFLGASSIVIDDGETTLLIDGFFSRPGLARTALFPLRPNRRRIAAALAQAHVTDIDAVLVAHSHYDHVLDAPAIAIEHDALFIGSSSSVEIARRYDAPEDRMVTLSHRGVRVVGAFTITALETGHSPNALATGSLSPRFALPARADAYRAQSSLSFHIAHDDGGSALVVTSANANPGSLRDVRAPVVFLAVGTLGKQNERFVAEYWRDAVIETEASLVVPIHWDDFTRELAPALAPMPWFMDDTEASLDAVMSRATEQVQVCLPVVFQDIELRARARCDGARRTSPSR